MWPIDRRFTSFINDKAINFNTVTQEEGATNKDNANVCSIRRIINRQDSSSAILERVTSLLADRIAVTKVFPQRQCYGVNARIHSRNDSCEVYQRVIPAVYLTIGDIIEKSKNESLEKQAAACKKAAEKSRKEIEYQNKQALRAITGSSRRDKKSKAGAVRALLSPGDE